MTEGKIGDESLLEGKIRGHKGWFEVKLEVGCW